MRFLETIVVYDLKPTINDGSDKKFLLTSKPCPLGAVCPLPRGYIHALNHEKTEAHGPQRSPECTAMKAIFSQNTVNVAYKKN